jgi:hypothetical protein
MGGAVGVFAWAATLERPIAKVAFLAAALACFVPLAWQVVLQESERNGVRALFLALPSLRATRTGAGAGITGGE